MQPELIAGLAGAIDSVAKYLNVASVDLLQWDSPRLRHLQGRTAGTIRPELASAFVRDHIVAAPEPLCNVLATRFLENTCKTSYAALLAPVFNEGCVKTDSFVAGLAPSSSLKCLLSHPMHVRLPRMFARAAPCTVFP